MRRLGGILAAGALALGLVGMFDVASAQTPDPRNWRQLDPENTLYIDTAHGRIVIELYPEVAPRHVDRIRTLARTPLDGSRNFYDGLIFHRVLDDFMAQTGDPQGTGQGASPLPDMPGEFMFRRGPDMPFVQAAEQNRARLGFYKALPVKSQPDAQMAVTSDGRVAANALHCQGVVSMARGTDLNSANSQFFIMRQPNTSLDKRYTIFGRVVWGQSAVMELAVGDPPPNPDRMLQVRVAADLPESERAPIYVLRTDGPRFRDLIEETRRERRADFNICDVDIPARVPRNPDRERSWWSIIPFIN